MTEMSVNISFQKKEITIFFHTVSGEKKAGNCSCCGKEVEYIQIKILEVTDENGDLVKNKKFLKGVKDLFEKRFVSSHKCDNSYSTSLQRVMDLDHGFHE